MFRYVLPRQRFRPSLPTLAYGLVFRSSVASTTDASSLVTSSFDIVGDGAIMTVTSGLGSPANEPTVSGWTAMGTTSSNARRITTFKRAGTFSGTATIDFGGQTQSFITYCVADAFGYDMANLEVQENFVLHQTSFETSTAGDPVTLSGFANPTNTVYVAIMHGGAAPNPTTFDAGMVTLQDDSMGSESITSAVAWNDAEDTQPDASWVNTGHYVIQAFELRQTAAAAAPVFRRPPNLAMRDFDPWSLTGWAA